MMRRKYFFLYLKTGGGHLAPARSLASFLETHYTDMFETRLIDGLQTASKTVRFCLEDGYKYLQMYGRWLYAFLYFLNKWLPVAHFTSFLVSFFVRPYLERCILNEQPEKIIIFHFFLIKPVTDILRRHRLNIPTLVVVTDPFTAHPLWFLEKDHHFIVFSEQVYNHCIEKGITPTAISVFPFILNEKFTSRRSVASKEILKEKMGFHLGKKLILIIGGADGMPKARQIVKNLLQENSETEIAIVCGNNQTLMNKMLVLKNQLNLEYLRVYGFTDSVYELLQISDIVITKCGASMFMETLLSRKIPIVNNYLWEQEKGNVDFLRKNQIGIYERDTKKISTWISKLFTDSHLLNAFHNNIERIQLMNGVDQVSDYIVKFTST